MLVRQQSSALMLVTRSLWRRVGQVQLRVPVTYYNYIVYFVMRFDAQI